MLIKRKTKMFSIILLAVSIIIVSSISSIETFEFDPAVHGEVDVNVQNDAPIIGVLAQEISYRLNQHWPGKYKSYIAASYIKFLEGGGARVVPIWIGKPEAYYEVMLSRVNGVLLPGGSTFFNNTNGYAESGAYVYKIAKRLNDNDIHFPLFGICLGFELFLYVSNQNEEYRSSCSSTRQALPLNFTKDYKQSRLFGSVTQEISDILENEAVTANFHIFCVTDQNMTDYHLNELWRVMSYNKDINGLEFISTAEHKNYPFYGIQFHPEKNPYEWKKSLNIPHTANAIKVTQYFSNFFVTECRKNANRFSGPTEENNVLIHRFPVTFTGHIRKSSFEQCYLFRDAIDYPNLAKEFYNLGDANVIAT